MCNWLNSRRIFICIVLYLLHSNHPHFCWMEGFGHIILLFRILSMHFKSYTCEQWTCMHHLCVLLSLCILSWKMLKLLGYSILIEKKKNTNCVHKLSTRRSVWECGSLDTNCCVFLFISFSSLCLFVCWKHSDRFTVYKI